MKKLITALVLLSSFSVFANSDLCGVSIEYKYSTENIEGKSFVNSPSGPVFVMSTSEIELYLEQKLRSKGYTLSQDNEPRDMKVEMGYFDQSEIDGSPVGGVSISLNSRSSTHGIHQTPGLLSQMFDSEEEQIEKVTKESIDDFVDHIPHSNSCD